MQKKANIKRLKMYTRRERMEVRINGSKCGDRSGDGEEMKLNGDEVKVQTN